jgi:formylglycine-generating enzyme required for sulfatase activity
LLKRGKIMGSNPNRPDGDKRSERDLDVASTEQASADKQPGVNTGGGAFVSGDVTAGEFVGRDKTIITEETSYHVAGLPNPYLGLSPFTYDDRQAYAGREQAVQEGLRQIKAKREQPAVWFVTGASGSGKSSFVQAGLLPALETHYRERGLRTRKSVFRPATDPLDGLAEGLAELRMGEIDPEELRRSSSAEFCAFLATRTPPGRANILVIDQFEECFTQADTNSRDWLFSGLANFPSFSQIHTHVLVTLRSDFLNELFGCKALWEMAKHGIELRAMNADELKKAILGPLEARRRIATREGDDRFKFVRFEAALLDRLALDAQADATYLPLLQVTLLHLWAGGKLKLEQYGGLAKSFQQRAERIYKYNDFNASLPIQIRPELEQAEIINILLDLVSVSLDDDARQDVRQSRVKVELERDQPLRKRLLEELVSARLLSSSIKSRGEQQIEYVDIIHESLLANWPRLIRAVEDRREQLRRRKRFENSFKEWLKNERNEAYLLSGIHMAEARELAVEKDIALESKEGKEFIQLSLEQSETELQRELSLERKARVGSQILATVLGILLFASLAWIAYPSLLRLYARGELASIPAGKAIVGPDSSYEAPRGTQSFSFELPAYKIERYEVTNRQYALCMKARGCSEPALPIDPERPNYPVTGVTAIQANDYCRWIGGHLPTEVEWERAARGAEGWLWPWENREPTPEHANLSFNGSTELMPVGSFPEGCSPSPEEVCDLIGNAAEWTASTDPAAENIYEPEKRWNGMIAGDENTPFLIYRGFDYTTGIGWYEPGTSLATLSRIFPPYGNSQMIGFRCSF